MKKVMFHWYKMNQYPSKKRTTEQAHKQDRGALHAPFTLLQVWERLRKGGTLFGDPEERMMAEGQDENTPGSGLVRVRVLRENVSTSKKRRNTSAYKLSGEGG